MEENNGNIRFLSVISYIGVLFVIGCFSVERDHPDLRFHTIQGGLLFVCFSVIYSFVFLFGQLFWFIPELQFIITLLLMLGVTIAYIFMIGIGISGAIKYEQKMLPYIGPAAVTLRTKLDRKKK